MKISGVQTLSAVSTAFPQGKDKRGSFQAYETVLSSTHHIFFILP